MKEAIVHKGLQVDIVDSPIPEPGANQLLIKVAVAGMNPKDWKNTQSRGITGNPGDDMAGTVVRVGAGVVEFRPGDRVAAFHEMRAPHGTYAEYAIAWAHTAFLLPAAVSFEEAATIPLAALTSVLALYKELALPTPFAPATEPLPLLIYGASTAVGHFALQLARRSNIHPVLAVAGASADEVVSGLLDPSRGDAIVDYRQGEQAVMKGVQAALAAASTTLGLDQPLTLRHAYDPASYQMGYITASKLMPGPGARLAVVGPSMEFKELEQRSVPLQHLGRTYVGQVHDGSAADQDLGYVFSRYLGHGLQQGWFHGHPHRVVPGGLDGVADALRDLMDGKVHGYKYVIRIADTEGLDKA